MNINFLHLDEKELVNRFILTNKDLNIINKYKNLIYLDEYNGDILVGGESLKCELGIKKNFNAWQQEKSKKLIWGEVKTGYEKDMENNILFYSIAAICIAANEGVSDLVSYINLITNLVRENKIWESKRFEAKDGYSKLKKIFKKYVDDEVLKRSDQYNEEPFLGDFINIVAFGKLASEIKNERNIRNVETRNNMTCNENVLITFIQNELDTSFSVSGEWQNIMENVIKKVESVYGINNEDKLYKLGKYTRGLDIDIEKS